MTNILDLSRYTFNPYASPPLVAGLLLAILGISVVVRERSSLAAVVFGLLLFCGTAWLLSYGGIYSASSRELALSWAKLENSSVVFIPSFLYLFALIIVRQFNRFKVYAWASFLFSFFLFFSIYLGDWFVSDVFHYWWGYYPQYGPLGFVSILSFFILTMASLKLYWVEYHRPNSLRRKWLLKRLLLAFSVAQFGAVDYLATFGIPIYPAGYIAVFIFIAVVAHALWRYRLADVTPAFVADEIISSMKDALIVVDHEGIIRIANGAACQLFKKITDEIVGISIWQLDEDFFSREQFQMAIERGVTGNYEVSFSHDDEKETPLSITTSIMKDRMNEPAAIVLIARDTTQEKWAEVALRESERRFRRLFESNIIGIIIADTQGNITEANDVFLNMVGYSREDLPLRWDEMTAPQFHQLDEQAIEELAKGGAAPPWEKEYIHKDGRHVPVLVGAALLEETMDRCVCFVLDLTVRKRAEEMIRKAHDELEKRVEERTAELSAVNQELKKYSRDLQLANVRLRKLDEAKSNFVALASHELKTPLTAMKGFLDLILQGKVGDLTKQQREFLNVVREATSRLNRLVEELLDISEIELGKTKMKMEPTDLNKLLKEETNIFQVQCDNKEIAVEKHIDPSVNDIVCDRDRIKEMLDNLISNAIKYTPRKGKIKVEARNLQDAVQISVEDTGVGIREEDHEKIFEPFQHIKKSGLEGEKSTGLGLALVKQIVEAHGGRVTVDSREGKGSVFSVILPANHFPVGKKARKNEEKNFSRRR